MVQKAVGVMTSLNRSASEVATEIGVSAATDVTGFGLLGHMHIALAAAKLSARVDASAVKVVPGTLELARQGVIPGGTRSNHVFVDPHMDWGELTEPEQLVLADAQTSGGLLLSVPEDRLPSLQQALRGRGVNGVDVGVVSSEGAPGGVEVTGRLTS
jgi:selenide,water dikinase